MTQPNHTPGPWRIGDAGTTVFGPKDPEHPAPVTVMTSPPVSPRVGFDERKANIRLIAAAPEMLEALEELLKAASPHLEGGPTKKAYWAIKKAKGE